MTTKEWLMRAWTIDEEIDALWESEQKAYDRCVSITTAPHDVVSGGERTNKFEAYLEYKEKLGKKIDKLLRVKAEIQDAIDKVQDGTLRTLLMCRYINHDTWESIAVNLGYSYIHICRLHGLALKKIIISNGEKHE